MKTPAVSLAAAQMLEFERTGHVRTRKLLPGAATSALSKEVDRLYTERESEALRQKVRVLLGDDRLARAEHKSAASPHVLRRILREELPEGAVPFMQLFNLWRTSPMVHELWRSPALAGTAASLLGVERVRLYQDSYFLKRPGDGPTHWHSDLSMAPLDTNSFVTCWLPLHDVAAPDDGGSSLVFASGSHRDVALNFWHGDPRRPVDASTRGYPLRDGGALRAGDATWHHGWVLHSASPNMGDVPRRAVAVSFYADGASRLQGALRSQDDEDAESCVAWLGDVRPGRAARHRLLPLVWPPDATGGGSARGSVGSCAEASTRARRSVGGAGGRGGRGGAGDGKRGRGGGARGRRRAWGKVEP